MANKPNETTKKISTNPPQPAKKKTTKLQQNVENRRRAVAQYDSTNKNAEIKEKFDAARSELKSAKDSVDIFMAILNLATSSTSLFKEWRKGVKNEDMKKNLKAYDARQELIGACENAARAKVEHERHPNDDNLKKLNQTDKDAQEAGRKFRNAYSEAMGVNDQKAMQVQQKLEKDVTQQVRQKLNAEKVAENFDQRAQMHTAEKREATRSNELSTTPTVPLHPQPSTASPETETRKSAEAVQATQSQSEKPKEEEKQSENLDNNPTLQNPSP